jgi:hypothetical protein
VRRRSPRYFDLLVFLIERRTGPCIGARSRSDLSDVVASDSALSRAVHDAGARRDSRATVRPPMSRRYRFVFPRSSKDDDADWPAAPIEHEPRTSHGNDP